MLCKPIITHFPSLVAARASWTARGTFAAIQRYLKKRFLGYSVSEGQRGKTKINEFLTYPDEQPKIAATFRAF